MNNAQLSRLVTKAIQVDIVNNAVALVNNKINQGVLDLCKQYAVSYNRLSSYVFNHNGTRYSGTQDYLLYALGTRKVDSSPMLRTKTSDFFTPSDKDFLAAHKDFLEVTDMFKKDFSILNVYLRKVFTAARNLAEVKQLITNKYLQQLLDTSVDQLLQMAPGYANGNYFNHSSSLSAQAVERFIEDNRSQANVIDEVHTKLSLFGL